MVSYDSVLMEVSFQLSGNELAAKTGRSLLQVWLWMFVGAVVQNTARMVSIKSISLQWSQHYARISILTHGH